MKKRKKFCLVAMIASMVLTNILGISVAFSETNASINKDSTAPIVKKISGRTANTIEITLEDTSGFNMENLWNKENYDIQGIMEINNVISVTKDTEQNQVNVTLETDTFTDTNAQKLLISNIDDVFGNIMTEKAYSFGPSLDELDSTQNYNQQKSQYTYNDILFYASAINEVTVIFKQASKLDTKTLRNIKNYSSNDLKFYDLLIRNESNENVVKVVLLTDDLKSEQQYHIQISNLKLKDTTNCQDYSISDYISFWEGKRLQNTELKMIKEVKEDMKEEISSNKVVENIDSIKEKDKEQDLDAPKVKMIRGKTETTMEVVLKDSSGFDMNCLWHKSNYNLQGTMQVKNVLTVDVDQNTVTIVLETDKFTSSNSQKIKISNIKDSFGNTMEEKSYSFAPHF